MAMANGPVTSDGNFPAPGCAARCWENTKYISKCADKSTCLCHDAEYQNSIFKCIYSQCDTAHFGSALHHTMTRCVGVADNLLVVPPVSNHDSLRRREAQYLGGVKLEDSGSIVGYPTLSGLSLQSALPVASAVAFSSIPPLIYLTRDTVRASATASPVTTPVESARTTYNTAPEFITTSPLLFTGDGLKVLPSIFFLFSAAISGLYLAV